jgi:inosine triphosphate pyrophosphatase
MPKIIFITGNTGKLKEARALIPSLISQDIDLPEIQEIDALKVIEAKLKEASSCQKGEYIVEDTSLYFDCLNGLPGPLIKWFMKRMGDQKLYELTEKYKNNKAIAKTFIGHIDTKGKCNYFEGSITGTIVNPRGDNGFGWDKIFQPDNSNKTFAEMSTEEKNKFSMRKIALEKFAIFMKL